MIFNICLAVYLTINCIALIIRICILIFDTSETMLFYPEVLGRGGKLSKVLRGICYTVFFLPMILVWYVIVFSVVLYVFIQVDISMEE